MGVSENEGYLILGSFSYGSYYLGYYIRVPYFRKLPHNGYVVSNGIDPGRPIPKQAPYGAGFMLGLGLRFYSDLALKELPHCFSQEAN